MATRSTYKTPVTGCSIDTISPAPTGAGGDLIQDNFTNIADALESIATDLGGKANTSSVTSALAGKADSTHTHTTSEITDLSTTLADYATTSALTTGLAGKSDSTHTHAYTEITGTPNLSGFLTSSDLAGYIAEPASDGTSGQVLTTDGAGGRNWTTVTSGSGGTTYTAGTGITISGTTISVTSGTYASSSHAHAASEITSGTLAIARIPTGTTSSTVALGDHTHTASTISNLATVATTGSYNDLSDRPTIPNAYTLPTATASVLGGVKVGTNLSISSGVLSATNTTYSVATTSANGLMSTSDKSKLDGITDSADSVSFSPSLYSGVSIGTITINGSSYSMYAPDTTQTTRSTASNTISMANNYIYNLTSTAITSITLTAANGMKYSGIDFKTSTTAPTFSYPAAWVMEGSDCTDGVFTVAASTRYRISIEYSTALGVYVGTVQKVSIL